MQLSYAALTAVLASLACAQSIADAVSQLPSCSLTCLQDGITQAGCSITDYACQCGAKKNDITKTVTPCLAQACPTSDLLKVQSVTDEVCKLAGSSSGGSSSESSPPASASDASSSASSAASDATSAASSAASDATSAASSVASEASSAVSSAASEASSAIAGATGAAGSGTSSSPPAATGNAGNKNQVAGAMVGAAVLAAFAL